MNNLVQDVLDGVENPSKAMKVLKKEQTKAIDKLQLITACLEEIEGSDAISDMEHAQRKVLRNRMSGHLHTVTEALENLDEILKTTVKTELSSDLDLFIYQIQVQLNGLKNELG